MTGAQPHTRWLQGCVVLDDHGFVKTGPDLGKEQLAAAHWNLPRPPYLLESSVPGVFAAVTCAPESVNVLLRPWARDRSAYSSCIECCANSPRPGISLRTEADHARFTREEIEKQIGHR